MKSHFSAFLRDAIGDGEHREFAARCGISASQLSKLLRGQQCERTTLVRVISGISADPHRRAGCMASFLRDLLPLAGPAASALIQIRVKK